MLEPNQLNTTWWFIVSDSDKYQWRGKRFGSICIFLLSTAALTTEPILLNEVSIDSLKGPRDLTIKKIKRFYHFCS